MKKQVCHLTLIAVLITLVFATSCYNKAIGEEAVTLKYNLKAGDLLVYKMKMGSRMSTARMPGPIPMDGEGIRTQVITEVSKEGVYSLITLDLDEITRAITSVGYMSMSLQRQKMRPDGSVLEASASAEEALEDVFLSTGKLPTTPVKKGETWKQEVKIPGGDSLDIQWTLVGFQKVKDYDCAQLEGAFTGSLPLEDESIPAEGRLIHFFAVKEGFMIAQKVELKMKLPAPPGVKGEGSLAFGFELELIKKEELPLPKLQETISALELISSGHTELRKSNYDVAISDFRRAIEVDLEPLRTYFLYPELARAYIKAGRSYGYDLEDALKLAEDLKKRTGNDAFSYMKLGDVYLIAEKYEEAIAAYKKAIELNPRHHYFKWKLARTYEKTGNSELAEQLYKEILEMK